MYMYTRHHALGLPGGQGTGCCHACICISLVACICICICTYKTRLGIHILEYVCILTIMLSEFQTDSGY